MVGRVRFLVKENHKYQVISSCLSGHESDGILCGVVIKCTENIYLSKASNIPSRVGISILLVCKERQRSTKKHPMHLNVKTLKRVVSSSSLTFPLCNDRDSCLTQSRTNQSKPSTNQSKPSTNLNLISTNLPA